jgi:hypothetical protein
MDSKEPCEICNKPSSFKCSVCKKVYYCSKKCQKENWKYHKGMCQTLKKDLADYNMDEVMDYIHKDKNPGTKVNYKYVEDKNNEDFEEF